MRYQDIIVGDIVDAGRGPATVVTAPYFHLGRHHVVLDFNDEQLIVPTDRIKPVPTSEYVGIYFSDGFTIDLDWTKEKPIGAYAFLVREGPDGTVAIHKR